MSKCSRCSFDETVYEKIHDVIDNFGLCNSFLHPNIVTFIGFILCLPLYENLKNRKLLTVLIIIVIRGILDCVDGSLARKCKKSSMFGSILDLLSDQCGILLVVYFIIHNICKYKQINYNVVLLIIALQVITVYSTTNLRTHESKNKIVTLIIDNSIMFLLLQYITWVLSVHYF